MACRAVEAAQLMPCFGMSKAVGACVLQPPFSNEDDADAADFVA
jgi:hypothetical protein